jgi:hypothetical protein
MMRIILFLAIFCVAARAGGDFDAGNRAYDDGKFLEARQHYEAQVTRGEWTANLFYNLGNANERIGAPGLAALSYERALALRRGHHEARASLKHLREQTLAKVDAQSWRDHAFGALDFDGWIAAASLAGWVAVFAVVVPFARRRPLGAGGVFVLVLALCAAGYAGWAAVEMKGELDAGVIVAKQAEARHAPTERAALADVLPAGSRVRVLAVRGEWTYCQLPSGTRAWVPSASVERVRLP